MNSKTTSRRGKRTAPAPCSPCKCSSWCDISHTHRMLTGHHEGCRFSPPALPGALKLISDMVKGIEAWAHEEDGTVHPELWEAYRKAKALAGVFLPPANTQAEGRASRTLPRLVGQTGGQP